MDVMGILRMARWSEQVQPSLAAIRGLSGKGEFARHLAGFLCAAGRHHYFLEFGTYNCDQSSGEPPFAGSQVEYNANYAKALGDPGPTEVHSAAVRLEGEGQVVVRETVKDCGCLVGDGLTAEGRPAPPAPSALQGTCMQFDHDCAQCQNATDHRCDGCPDGKANSKCPWCGQPCAYISDTPPESGGHRCLPRRGVGYPNSWINESNICKGSCSGPCADRPAPPPPANDYEKAPSTNTTELWLGTTDLRPSAGMVHNLTEGTAVCECVLTRKFASGTRSYYNATSWRVGSDATGSVASSSASCVLWADNSTLETAGGCTEARAFLATKSDDYDGLAPAVYWVSRPVYSGETLVVAGAGFASSAANSTRFCRDANCSTVVANTLRLPSSWASSLHISVPDACVREPPCKLAVGHEPALVVDVNGPEVTWSPNRTVAGGYLRVFGRSLGWAGGRCISGARLPGPALSTILKLGGIAVPAGKANCYEAAFQMPANLSGRFDAVVTTEWGSSATFVVDISDADAAFTHIVDVDREHGGSLQAALAAASRMPSGRIQVRLTRDKEYEQHVGLTVPSNTFIVGSTGTVLAFVFAPSHAPSNASAPPKRCTGLVPVTDEAFCPAAITGVGSGWGLDTVSIIVRQWPTGAAAIEVPKSSSSVRLLKLNVSLMNSENINAIRVLGDNVEVGWSSISLLQGSCTGGAVITHGASEFWLHDSSVVWNCGGWGCLDVSDRFILERNVFSFTDVGSNVSQIPGGAFPAWDLAARPGAKFASIARNHWQRPPRSGVDDPNHRDWQQGSETLTSDAPFNEFAHGFLLPPTGDKDTTTIQVKWSWIHGRPIVSGTALVVIAGPGVGQIRDVRGYNASSNAVSLDRPLATRDSSGKFAMAGSIV